MTQFTVQISINNGDFLYSSFGYYLCKNIMKKDDSDFEFFDCFDTQFSMRPVVIPGDVFASYYIPGMLEKPYSFKYKNILFNLSVKNYEYGSEDDNRQMQPFGTLNISSTDSSFPCIIEDLFKKAHDEYKSFYETITKPGHTSVFIAEGCHWDLVDRKKNRDIDSVYLPEDTKRKVTSKIEKFLDPETIKKYESFGVPHKCVFLFEGVPGSGKTSFISAVAAKYGYGISTLYFNTNLDDTMLMRVIKNKPKNTFLVIEDMDYLFRDRKAHDSEKNMTTIGGILNCLDGLATPSGFICFLSTNFLKHIDEAVIRPGRVDAIIHFDYAVPEQVHQIYKNFMSDNYTAEKYEKFQSKLNALNIKYTVSLIQQHLLLYIDDPEGAVENIGDIKKYKEASTVDSTGENMYS